MSEPITPDTVAYLRRSLDAFNNAISEEGVLRRREEFEILLGTYAPELIEAAEELIRLRARVAELEGKART